MDYYKFSVSSVYPKFFFSNDTRYGIRDARKSNLLTRPPVRLSAFGFWLLAIGF